MFPWRISLGPLRGGRASIKIIARSFCNPSNGDDSKTDKPPAESHETSNASPQQPPRSITSERGIIYLIFIKIFLTLSSHVTIVLIYLIFTLII